MQEEIKNNENSVNKEEFQKKDVKHLRIVFYSSIISFLIYYGILVLSVIVQRPSDGDFLTGLVSIFILLPVYFVSYIFVSLYFFKRFSKKYNTSYKTGTYVLHFLFYSWFMFLMCFLVSIPISLVLF